MLNETIFSSFLAEIILCLLALIQLILTIGWSRDGNYLLIQVVVTAQTFFILLITWYVLLHTSVEISADLFINNIVCKKLKLMILFFSMPLVFVISHSAKFQKVNFPEFMSLYLLSIFCLMLLISANDFLLIYILLEVQSAISYTMTCFNRRSAHSTDAALKYFVLGAIFSCILVFGALLIYVSIGTLNLEEAKMINQQTPEAFPVSLFGYSSFEIYVQFIGVICILTVLIFKFGGAPFFYWAPDVYEGAPMSATIAISIVPKISFLCVTSKMITTFEPVIQDFEYYFMIVGCLTIFLGTSFALRQKRLKRLLIYSSMTQTGFFFLCLSTKTIEGTLSLYLFFFGYVVGTSMLWCVLSFLYTSQLNINTFKGERNLRSIFISELSSFVSLNSILGFLIVAVIFGVAGMPPSFNFFAKFFILFALTQEELFEIATTVVVITSYSYFYYIRMIKVLVFETESTQKKDFMQHPEFTDEMMDTYHVFLILGIFLVYFPIHHGSIILALYFL